MALQLPCLKNECMLRMRESVSVCVCVCVCVACGCATCYFYEKAFYEADFLCPVGGTMDMTI